MADGGWSRQLWGGELWGVCGSSAREFVVRWVVAPVEAWQDHHLSHHLGTLYQSSEQRGVLAIGKGAKVWDRAGGPALCLVEQCKEEVWRCGGISTREVSIDLTLSTRQLKIHLIAGGSSRVESTVSC